ncbi:Hint domain-containing protein [uncultured Alsobacter sp.]|uniref:Hint domain-containing protein n=1 Tax=uncultured Alsobacter sp. TaxID=1748258 RepID=UPI0025D07CBB|nr:Hint domain-containing protein [uncultured Alsobacter sp.]
MAFISGTGGDDNLSTNGSDLIFGKGGNDTLTGGASPVTFFGEEGDDKLVTGSGGGFIDGGIGNDTLIAGDGDTIILSGSGDNLIETGGGNATVSLGSGNNTVTGGDGDIVVTSEGGNNTIVLGSGNANLQLGGGADNITAGSGELIVDGGAGNDTITGGDGFMSVSGGEGDDTIVLGGGGGNVSGGGGTDTYVFGPGTAVDTTISDFNAAEDKIDLTQSGAGDLIFTDDGNGNTIITSSDGSVNITVQGASASQVQDATDPPCYLRGTLIRTATGEVPVESLAIGDMVMTLDGAARPVKWIGRRTYAPSVMARSPKLTPVCFRKGSLGANLPHSDLYVSHDHAMFVNGVFVDASILENGANVVREFPGGPTIDYFHIELEGHAIVYANGVTAESYVNHGNRTMFQNWSEYAALYGEDLPAAELEDGGHERSYPAVKSGPELEAIRAEIGARIEDIEVAYRKVA